MYVCVFYVQVLFICNDTFQYVYKSKTVGSSTFCDKTSVELNFTFHRYICTNALECCFRFPTTTTPDIYKMQKNVADAHTHICMYIYVCMCIRLHLWTFSHQYPLMVFGSLLDGFYAWQFTHKTTSFKDCFSTKPNEQTVFVLYVPLRPLDCS